jgi:hypothetical protein
MVATTHNIKPEADYPARVIDRKSHFELLADKLRKELDKNLARSKAAAEEIIETARMKAEMYEDFARRSRDDLRSEKEELERIAG